MYHIAEQKKDKKYVISWFKALQYVKLKHKSSCNYSFFHTQFEKINFRKFAVAINFIDFCWQLIVLCFYHILYVHTSMELLMEVRTILDLFYVILPLSI